MLSIDTLSKKSKSPSPDVFGDSFIDFTAASFQYKTDVNVISSVIVSDDFEMRPDLVARVYYGDVSKLDYVLKFNGISNPFSLESGTILLIGELKGLEQNFVKGATTDQESKKADLRAQFFDPNRLSKKDAKRLELVQQKSASFANGSTTNLPPNIAPVGATEAKVVNGVVIFGGDVVGNAANCPTVLSRAAVKAKLIEQKTFKNV